MLGASLVIQGAGISKTLQLPASASDADRRALIGAAIDVIISAAQDKGQPADLKITAAPDDGPPPGCPTPFRRLELNGVPD